MALALDLELGHPGAELGGGVKLAEDALGDGDHVGSREDHRRGCCPRDAANSNENGPWPGLRAQPL